jgi:CTP-dependent riboflavin kinase
VDLDSILSGHVRSGKGDAAQWLARFAAEYAKKLGAPIFPGSLNVELADHFDWFAPALQPLIVHFARHEYGGERDILLLP